MKRTTTISEQALRRAIVLSRLRRWLRIGFAIPLLLSISCSLVPELYAQVTSNPGIPIADFNGDGIPDVLLPSPATASFTISFGGVPFGTFGAVSKSVPYPAGCAAGVPAAVTTGDFNGDGLADLVITCTGSTPQPTTFVLLGAGDGTFNRASASSTGQASSTPTALAGDFNHDGKLDLVVAGVFGANEAIYFLPGNGDGTFGSAVTTTLTSTGYSSVLAVDLNGDGYPDLVFGNFAGQNAHTLDIYANNKDGTFGSADGTSDPNSSIAVGAYPASTDTAILAGNYYGTGLPDLAVVDTGTTPGVFIIQNNSTDGFSFGAVAKTAVPGLKGAISASFTSLFSDLLVSNGTTLSVLANDGTGTFTASYAGLSVASATTFFNAADANGDGHADIYTAAVTTTGAALAVDLVSGSASASSTPFSLAAGTYPVAAAWPGNINFAGSTLNGTQTVGGILPTITWPAPAAIPYGTPLSGTQLDATAATAAGVIVPGTFVYSPAAGTVLGVGTHMLSVTFTPTDLITYTVATDTVALQVNQGTPLLTWTPTVTSIGYGTALGTAQLNAVATAIGGATIPGSYVYTPAVGTVLDAGTQTLSVVFTPTDVLDYLVARATTQIAVTQSTPTLTWATPASIAYGIPLNAAQLDAAASGVTGAALPGTFVYTPAAGTILNPGTQTLSTTFTPANTLDYAAATATVKLTITDIVLGSFTPNTAALAAPATTITVTGSGLVASTVAQVNGTAIATTLVNPTTLTAVIPAADFLVPGTLQITLKNPTTGSVSDAVTFTVTAPSLSGTLSGPPTTPPGTQPTLTFTIPPYPVDLTAVLTVSLKSSLASGVTDAQNVVFANGTDTYSFVIKAGTTMIPAIPLAAGTVAETITVTPTLFVGTVNVTPDGLAPVVIDVPAEVPQQMSTTLTRSGDQLTVTIIGFSNTREIASAAFHFVAAPGATLAESDISPSVDGVFTSWYGGTDSQKYGSSFTYTQTFLLSDTAANIGSVQVTLTNSVGVSLIETAQ